MKVVLVDYGVKKGIVDELVARDAEVIVLPAHASAEQIKSHEPSGILLSNGPGDPSILTHAHRTIRELDGCPIFGICLGHQLLAHAFGGSTYKLKFGHRGSNHPVLDKQTGRVAITTQNHGFAVDTESLPDDFEVTHTNLNDGTVEGMRHRDRGILGTVPSRGESRAARLEIHVRQVHEADGGMQMKKVLVIGSGPIVIGQSAEFDYSGAQACRALREEGMEIVLVNSNPATIQTDSEMADRIYIEPLTADVLESIIEKEKPDGLLATVGGQTGLNLAMQLHKNGVLERHGVSFMGTDADAIETAESRERFNALMRELGIPILPGEVVKDFESAKAFAERIGYPVIARPSFTLGGTGGGTAKDEGQLKDILELGFGLSATGEVLVEKSGIGWGEFEYEVIRDADGNSAIICNMENFDPMGIHTGESIVAAPVQTLSDRDNQMLRDAAIRIVDAIGVKGSCNVQFALNQETGEYTVIEVNPRLSRSSALASKATGYPIARVATKIALGMKLHEIKNAITGTSAAFEPALDYVVVKMPRWPFDKF
ncbi:MAG TPA: carbamoyl-phosphate synthase large subunit, partial [Chromatiaceae bacterium]|nr:carbamoyl-phosphate synthase large subunit [Chromatiaceae bacterium]